MARKNLLKGFKRPKNIVFEHGEIRQNYGKFIGAPFEPGFGVTIGNTLRRVLLKSIQGYAICAIRINTYDSEGVAHNVASEFENIPNVSEDTLEIINSMKQIRLKLPEDVEQYTVMYEWTGKREVMSEDFAKEGEVEIMNPGLKIMTLMDNAKVDFEVQYEMGRGYLPAEMNEDNIDVIGTIPIDAIFTPVKRVKYSVEPTRVGQRNDYDKLIMEIETDGTIRPDDALAEAAKITKEHLSVFINFDESELGYDEDFEDGDERMRQLLNTPVEELELSVRSANCLRNANIKTIGELVKKSEEDIKQTRNFGSKSLQEIKDKLQEWNLSLGSTEARPIADSEDEKE
ncbi:MAG: DNA-directed RNA polymerase subunit alpha [Spirochaetaceae bacterium]|jgi:DNA-directed RNA polymerase subunit alpha|nr:DNA-directed RNA polymerase subunit alpha [Spirochaetaceae bacterium]